jgi:ribosome-associated protein
LNSFAATRYPSSCFAPRWTRRAAPEANREERNLSPTISTAVRKTKTAPISRGRSVPREILTLVLDRLEDEKAEDTVSIDLRGKTTIADHMVVTSGRSQRHVGAIAEHLVEALEAGGARGVRVEGLPHCDWVLIDAGDVIVHVFRPEVRAFYNLEKMWARARPAKTER